MLREEQFDIWVFKRVSNKLLLRQTVRTLSGSKRLMAQITKRSVLCNNYAFVRVTNLHMVFGHEILVQRSS